MAHLHNIYDSDIHFKLDSKTRTFSNETELKLLVAQGDHNSEIFTFEIPRYIEQHDMLKCNRIEIHYINISSTTRDTSKDVYYAEDLQVSPEDENIVIFSWPLRGNATKYNGSLSFSISFKCLEGDEITYRWNTLIYSKISVGKSLNNAETIAQEYSDVLEKWKKEVLENINPTVTIDTELNEESDNAIANCTVAKKISQLSDSIADLKVGVDKDTITNAVYSYLTENPVEGNGLTSTVKTALMNLVEHIGVWADENGQKYIDELRTALYTAPLSSISAVYTQTKTVYASDDLETLKEDLVVTGIYADGSSSVITDYTLSGTFTIGTSIITISKDGKTATFEVTVTASRVPATGIILDKTTLSFESKAPIQLVATVEPSNTTDTVTWSSSEDAVATVEDGLVTPQADGSCKIYATAGDITVECSVSVALPLSGINIGNPFLTKVDGMPSSVATTEEEAQGKWYKAVFTAWTKALNIEKTFFLHPLTNGTFYIRMVGRTLSEPIEFYAFQNADIGLNPTATLGKVGGEYTNATVTKLTTFDWVDYVGNEKSSTVNLGKWTNVDNSGTTYDDAFVALYKVVVPKNVYVFMTTSEMGANRFPGISENYPYMNDLYTIFDSDPSANILQVVE